MTSAHDPARFILGYAFTWDDLMDVARHRATETGHRQRVNVDRAYFPRTSFTVMCLL